MKEKYKHGDLVRILAFPSLLRSKGFQPSHDEFGIVLDSYYFGSTIPSQDILLYKIFNLDNNDEELKDETDLLIIRHSSVETLELLAKREKSIITKDFETAPQYFEIGKDS